MSRLPTTAGVLAAGLLLALTACGGGTDGTDGPSGTSDLEEVRSGDVPEECAEPFPMAVVPADLADVALRPADFPDPPVDATLCQTSSTLDDSLTIADYATPASATEVLDAYETLLATSYAEVEREDQGMGEQLTADLGDGRYLQLTPGEGRYSLAFGTG